MINVSGILLPYTSGMDEVRAAAAKILRISEKDILSFAVRKRSLDARKKPDLFYEYQADVETAHEDKVLKHAARGKAAKAERPVYHFPEAQKERGTSPVIIGAGPSGLFAALLATVFFWHVTGIGCPIRWLTGIPCAGCGMTRAVVSLSHGHVREALSFHPLVFLLPLALAGLALKEAMPEKVPGKAWRCAVWITALLFVFV